NSSGCAKNWPRCGRDRDRRRSSSERRFPMYQLAIALALFLPAVAAAAEPIVLPPTVELSGPVATQRLLVVDTEQRTIVGDRTAEATFASSNPGVATVDQAGVVRAAGDGEVVITATVGGTTATARAVVRRTKEPFVWGYRNHV